MKVAQRSSLTRGRGAFAAGLLLTACVQEVTVIDGAGGTGGAPTAPPATIEEVRAACTELCDNHPCDLWPHFCETECNSVLVSDCYAESLAILRCLIAAPRADCSLSYDLCDKEVEALYNCRGGSPEGGAPLLLDQCHTGACVPGDGCSCSGLCGPAILIQECVQVDEGHATCTCYDGDVALFTCEQMTASCDMADCCGTQYP